MTSTVLWTFRLDRHDEPDNPPPQDPPGQDPPDDPEEPPQDPPEDEPPEDPDGDPDKPATDDKDKKGEPGEVDWEARAKAAEAETAKWKGLSRKHEKTAKDNAGAAKKLGEIEDAQKTETERLAAAKEAAEKRATAATERAVRAEVKALSTEFVDPSDAESAITAADFIGEDGEIDTEAIKARLVEILDAKPHWRKPPPEAKPTKPPKPKPDPGQGARGDVKPTSFKDASAEEYAAELGKYRLRPRTGPVPTRDPHRRAPA